MFMRQLRKHEHASEGDSRYECLYLWCFFQRTTIKACAIASGSRIIVSGDKHLIKVSGFEGIEVLKPSEFVKRHLQVI